MGKKLKHSAYSMKVKLKFKEKKFELKKKPFIMFSFVLLKRRSCSAVMVTQTSAPVEASTSVGLHQPLNRSQHTNNRLTKWYTSIWPPSFSNYFGCQRKRLPNCALQLWTHTDIHSWKSIHIFNEPNCMNITCQ